MENGKAKNQFLIVRTLCTVIFLIFLGFIKPASTVIAIKNEVLLGVEKIPRLNKTETPAPSNSDQVLLDYAFSPDGSRLAIYTNKKVSNIDLRNKNEEIIQEFRSYEYSKLRSGAVAFSPDGNRIAIAGKNSNEAIRIIDLDTNKEIRKITDLPEDNYVTEIEFTPDGKTLMVRNTEPDSKRCESPEDTIYLINLISGRRIYEVSKCQIYPPLKIQLLENQTAMIFYKSMIPEYTVIAVNTDTGEMISKEEFNYSKDGTDFYEVSNDGRYRLISVLNDASKKYRETIIYDVLNNEEVERVEGKVLFYKDLGRYIVEKTFYSEDGKLNSDYSFFDKGKTKCEFTNMMSYEPVKTNFGRDIAATYSSTKEHVELQVWTISNCGLVYDQVFIN